MKIKQMSILAVEFLVLVAMFGAFVGRGEETEVATGKSPEPACRAESSYAFVFADNSAMRDYKYILRDIVEHINAGDHKELLSDISKLEKMLDQARSLSAPPIFSEYQKYELMFLEYKIKSVQTIAENHNAASLFYQELAEHYESLMAEAVFQAMIKCHPSLEQ